MESFFCLYNSSTYLQWMEKTQRTLVLKNLSKPMFEDIFCVDSVFDLVILSAQAQWRPTRNGKL